MKRISFLMSLLCLVALTACYGPGGGGGGSAAGAVSILSPPGANPEAAKENDDGVDHFKQGHSDVAAKHFRKAVAADPNFAEAHFNLGLALNETGDHEGATDNFKKAKELAENSPNKETILGNATLQKHL